MCMSSPYLCGHVFPVPELMAPPEVSALSSTSLKVEWSSAEGQGIIARGRVTEYRVNMLTEQTSNPYAPPLINQVRQTHPHIHLQIMSRIIVRLKSFSSPYIVYIHSFCCCLICSFSEWKMSKYVIGSFQFI